jgi:ribonuclease Z
LRTAAGQKIAYVVDIGYHEHNVGKVNVEAPFLDMDADIAAQRRHLTRIKPVELAGQARIAHVIPFHFSARYSDRADELGREMEAAFENFRCNPPFPHPSATAHSRRWRYPRC